jgi:DNA-binding transcriptional ArsR family regulator
VTTTPTARKNATAAARFDELIHAPTRLAIVSLLAASQRADFSYIRDQLGLSDSALSKQLSTLESAGYVEIHRRFVGKRPRASAALSRAGRQAFNQHAAALQALLASSPAGRRQRNASRVVASRPGNQKGTRHRCGLRHRTKPASSQHAEGATMMNAGAEVEQSAAAWAAVAIENIRREFPHQSVLYLRNGDDHAPRPRELHPSFFGSYDWHSCVEMHWVLVRLLRVAESHVPAQEIRELLNHQLTGEKLLTETAHLPRWERPYGFGWLLMLAAELLELAARDSDATAWSTAMEPLTAEISRDLLGWLRVAKRPVRTGLHSNSAFGLTLALRWARPHDRELAQAISGTARRWYADDVDCPGRYEPSDTDFLSPCLTEAELMSCIVPAEAFVEWFNRFLPHIADGEPAALFIPAEVSDTQDGQMSHLHGLNLSRAWCWRRIASALPAGDPRCDAMLDSARRHADASLTEAVDGNYLVTHWLSAYALLLTSEADGRHRGQAG